MIFRFPTKIVKCAVLIVAIVFVYQSIGKFKTADQSYENLSSLEIENIVVKAKIRNDHRISNVDEVCRKYNLGIYRNDLKPTAFKEPPAPQYEIFFYDLKHKLSWCPIYKAGTSTWLFNLALLGGYSEDEVAHSKQQINDVVRKILPVLESDDAKQALLNSLKFIIVRHPFERILSAYRDKLENVAVRGIDGTRHFYQSFGAKIVAKYRPGGNNTNSRTILKHGQYIWNEDKEPVGVEPTFKEFVKHLIGTDLRTRADDHWIPNYLFCTPCLVKYDIIGKLETMLEDQIFIIYSADLQHKITPRWRHKTNPFSSRAKAEDVSEIAKVYFSQLNQQEVEELFKKYQLDFELFGYSEKEYYKYASK